MPHKLTKSALISEGKVVCVGIITVLSGVMMLFGRNAYEVQITGLVTFLLFIYIPNMAMIKRLLQPALPQKHCLFIEMMLSFRDRIQSKHRADSDASAAPNDQKREQDRLSIEKKVNSMPLKGSSVLFVCFLFF